MRRWCSPDLTLPDDSYLESWGFQNVTPPGDRPAISGFQPVVSRIYDTRATSDVFLDLAQRLGGVVKAAVPYANTVEFMKSAMTKLVTEDAPYATTERRRGVGRLAPVRRLVAADHRSDSACGDNCPGDVGGAPGGFRRLARGISVHLVSLPFDPAE